MRNLEPKGLADFRERYGSENIVEYDQVESRLLPRAEQCLNCGLCLAVCPVLRSLTVSGEEYAGPRSIATSLSRSVPHFWAASDTIYYCTLCGACEALCPGQVPIPEIVAMIRGKLPRQTGGVVPPAHAALADNLKEFANVYGEPIEPLSHRRQRAEFVYFAGCVGSYLERESVENTLRLLDRLGVSVTAVDEVCCGGPTRVAGVPMVEELAQRNLETILTTGTRKVITGCPRCYHTLSRHQCYAGQLEVIHVTQFLARFEWPSLTNAVVTYHDPCELGRHHGQYHAAREVIGRAMPNFVEPRDTREMAACCGAGGGLRGVHPRLSLQIARSRLEHLISTGSKVVLTECSACLHNFRNARRSRDDVEIYNLSEYLNTLHESRTR